MFIRTKLILWYSGLLVVIIVSFGLAVFGVMRMALTATIDRTLENVTQEVRANSRASVIAEFGAPQQVRVYLPELDTFGLSGVLVQVWSLNGSEPRLIDASANIEDYHEALDNNALAGMNADEGGVFYSDIIKNGTEWRVRTQTLDVWGRQIAVQVAASSQVIKEATNVLLVVMVVASGISILGSIVLGLWLSSRALKPVNQIAAAASQIAAADDLKTRLNWVGPMDELGRLTSVFNLMMGRLEHLFTVQQRFVADVSHELRTPLTAIRGNLDLIKRYGMDAASLEAIEDEVERMSRLVNDLLFLARADYGELRIQLEPVDLDTVVSEVYRDARILSKDRDLKLRIIDFEPVRVNGSSDRIKQLLLNLVSNAIKFTPDGGTITLNLRLEDDDAVLEVADTGIGISAEDRARIFDRFFQADSSRARHHAEGVGLGLSIARWIVDAHHGTISVDSTPGSGTTFTVRIPALVERHAVSSAAITRPRLAMIRRAAQNTAQQIAPRSRPEIEKHHSD